MLSLPSGNRDKNLVNHWYESICVGFGVARVLFRRSKSRGFKALRSEVPLATFNRDKNLIKSPRADLSGFWWVMGAVTTNRDKYLAGPQCGLALGRM